MKVQCERFLLLAVYIYKNRVIQYEWFLLFQPGIALILIHSSWTNLVWSHTGLMLMGKWRSWRKRRPVKKMIVLVLGLQTWSQKVLWTLWTQKVLNSKCCAVTWLQELLTHWFMGAVVAWPSSGQSSVCCLWTFTQQSITFRSYPFNSYHSKMLF